MLKLTLGLPRATLRMIICTAFAMFLPAFTLQAFAGENPIDVVQIKLRFSNVYIIRTTKPILIDSGTPKDLPLLVEELGKLGLKLKDLSLLVLTHSHSDHAGLAARLQREGVKVALGEGDVSMAKSGHNDDLKPTNFTAHLLKLFAIDPNFEPFTPDFVVTNELDLQPWGIDGWVVQMPGHTPGSLVLQLKDGRAFVGDMMLGGYLGGQFSPNKAGQHYFHADNERNLKNIQTLLSQPINTFYLGHGGPVDRSSVIEAFGARETSGN